MAALLARANDIPSGRVAGLISGLQSFELIAHTLVKQKSRMNSLAVMPGTCGTFYKIFPALNLNDLADSRKSFCRSVADFAPHRPLLC